MHLKYLGFYLVGLISDEFKSMTPKEVDRIFLAVRFLTYSDHDWKAITKHIPYILIFIFFKI